MSENMETAEAEQQLPEAKEEALVEESKEEVHVEAENAGSGVKDGNLEPLVAAPEAGEGVPQSGSAALGGDDNLGAGGAREQEGEAEAPAPPSSEPYQFGTALEVGEGEQVGMDVDAEKVCEVVGASLEVEAGEQVGLDAEAEMVCEVAGASLEVGDGEQVGLDADAEKVCEVAGASLEVGEGEQVMDDAKEEPEEYRLEEEELLEATPLSKQPALYGDPSPSFIFDFAEGEESGTEEEQAEFIQVLEKFYKDNSLEFKAPKFYGEGLNCLKLWRGVTKLGGYDQVTVCKLWRQVGESFRPPKTCTTVSWSFRIFYEKALLEYEKHKIRTGELQVPVASTTEPMSLDHQVGGNQSSGSGRARRDAAARAMQGWHSQRLLGNGEVGDPIIKDKNSVPLFKRDKHIKSIGILKRKKTSSLDRAAVKVARAKVAKPHSEAMVVDVGARADWVKVNVRQTKDCFEIYALVPGLLREEVHVQSDPAGRLVITGEPEQPDNPWGVTPFKKVVTLSSRINPHQTSAVVTLHGQLFIRAPFEQQPQPLQTSPPPQQQLLPPQLDA